MLQRSRLHRPQDELHYFVGAWCIRSLGLLVVRDEYKEATEAHDSVGGQHRLEHYHSNLFRFGYNIRIHRLKLVGEPDPLPCVLLRFNLLQFESDSRCPEVLQTVLHRNDQEVTITL